MRSAVAPWIDYSVSESKDCVEALRRAMQRLTPAQQVTRWMFVATAYGLAGLLGLTLASVNPSATAVWPPAGIALAAVLIWGRRVWPGIFVGALVVNEITAGSLATSLAIAIGNTGEALLGAYLVMRFAHGRAALNRVRDVFTFVLLAGLLSTMVSATIGVTSLSLSGFASWPAYTSIWLTWWLGDLAGAVVVAPVLLLWWNNPRVHWSRAQVIEGALLLLILLVVGWIVFVATTSPLGFLCLPLCVWIGFRFGQREAATASCVLSALAVWGTTRGFGSFSNHDDALMLLQLFMATTSVVGIVVGAAVSERRYAEDRVRDLNDELERRVAMRTAELQAAHDQRRTSQARLADAQEVAHIGSWEWTVPEDRMWWSDELYRIFALDRASFQSSYDATLDFVHPDDRPMVHRTIQQSLDRMQPFELEHRILRPDGEIRTLYTKGRVLQGDCSQSVRIVGTGQDITERRRLEAQLQQAQKMKAIGHVAGGIAHDFNNVLTVINGLVEISLERVSEHDPVHEDLVDIHRASDKAAALTRQLLAFSRQQIPQPRILNLTEVVTCIKRMLERLLREDICLVSEPAAGLRSVKADPGQIEQVIFNLAINARDAMPDGGTLTIETRNVTIDRMSALTHGVSVPPGSYVMLAISDTGSGMDGVTRQQIFEPFFTTKGPGKGTGLGLATVYGIVQQSQGHICVESKVGHGTTFKMYLPEVAEAAHEEEHAPAMDSPSGTETILFVDDDESVCMVAKRMLESAGYNIITAANGTEALRLADRPGTGVDLLLTDLVMPQMSGRELARRLHMRRRETPVLYASGYTDDVQVLHEAVTVGVPLVSKPFTAAELLHKVRHVLDAPREKSGGEPQQMLEG